MFNRRTRRRRRAELGELRWGVFNRLRGIVGFPLPPPQRDRAPRSAARVPHAPPGLQSSFELKAEPADFLVPGSHGPPMVRCDPRCRLCRPLNAGERRQRSSPPGRAARCEVRRCAVRGLVVRTPRSNAAACGPTHRPPKDRKTLARQIVIGRSPRFRVPELPRRRPKPSSAVVQKSRDKGESQGIWQSCGLGNLVIRLSDYADFTR